MRAPRVAHALVAALALVWCAVRVRADEYGGAGMPQYADSAEYAAAAGPASGALDYRVHSPDAPAPLDYKYEEEPQVNTEKSTKDTIEVASRKRPARKQRGLGRGRDEPSDGGADIEPLHMVKPSRRRRNPRRHRPRLSAEQPVHRRHGSQDEDSNPMDYLDRNVYRIDKNKLLVEDAPYSFNPKETTEVVLQRNPRDRLLSNYVKPLKSSDLESYDELTSERKLKSSSSKERADRGRGGGGSARSGDRERHRAVPAPPPELPEGEDDEEEAQRPRARHQPNEYHDYNDYYDMRRIHNIRSELPMLLRRTKTRSPQPAPPDGRRGTSTMDLLSMLWTARRAHGLAATFAPAPPDLGTTHKRERDPTEPPEPFEPSEITTTTMRTIRYPVRTSSESTSELSIAEKSRLSILKKSQKKEMEKSEPSKKPLVLLQVTSKMPTIVMVEPATSANPWMRARMVSGDSPKKLEKVKRLMRQKLIAGANSIQDLTDNWDDMVCDYIDVALLDIAIAHRMSLSLLCVTHAFVLLVR